MTSENVSESRAGEPPKAVSAKAGDDQLNRWLRAVASGGRQTLASKSPGSTRCKFDAAQLRVLETMLDAGTAASGWSDQCWTLARIAEVVRRRFGVDVHVQRQHYYVRDRREQQLLQRENDLFHGPELSAMTRRSLATECR
ncbi:winged helix-turn-helix domain-containing protein [Streptomyces sp. NPDC023838]|uniref:winged helix-turn-helix domain-containing protein n=1 Tax=Streptomyces sp. NPDC023838 TaxID=3154325 RepID=UPI0033D692C2